MKDGKESRFIDYEYKNVMIPRGMESVCIDSCPNFGWEFDGSMPHMTNAMSSLKFKRSRVIKNKIQRVKLERQFEEHTRTIGNLKKSKTNSASISSLTIGFLGAAFTARAVFAYLAGMLILMVVLAVPGFLGWILPCFCYKRVFTKQNEKVSVLIDEQYDALYDICEKAHSLLVA